MAVLYLFFSLFFEGKKRDIFIQRFIDVPCLSLILHLFDLYFLASAQS